MTWSCCVIPGCDKISSMRGYLGEWICGGHWESVPDDARRSYIKAVRHFRDKPSLADRRAAAREAWGKCKRCVGPWTSPGARRNGAQCEVVAWQ